MVNVDLRNNDAVFGDTDRLLARVAAGDRAAFEHLYRDTAATLMGVCLRVLPDRAEAEDVLQEVFVSVWSKATQFDPTRSRAISWLCSIARNRAIDRLRSLPAATLRASIEWAEALPDTAPSPAARAETAADRVRLDDCIDALDPRRRVLIRTAFFEGASYSELANRSGSPLGSVKSWIRRALAELRHCLER